MELKSKDLVGIFMSKRQGFFFKRYTKVIVVLFKEGLSAVEKRHIIRSVCLEGKSYGFSLSDYCNLHGITMLYHGVFNSKRADMTETSVCSELAKITNDGEEYSISADTLLELNKEFRRIIQEEELRSRIFC